MNIITFLVNFIVIYLLTKYKFLYYLYNKIVYIVNIYIVTTKIENNSS